MHSSTIALLDWDNSLRRGFTPFDWSSFLSRYKAFSQQINDDMSNLLALYSLGQLKL